MTVRSAAVYDPIAAWYAESFLSGSPVHAIAMPALLELAGDVSGLTICDLACGTGIAARALTARGAQVVGIDASEELLKIARADSANEPDAVRYVLADVQELAEITTASFDGAVCNLALMDVPDLDRCLSEVGRIVRPGGWAVFTIVHPCFQPPDSRWTGKAGGTVKREVRGYFREGFWRSDNANGVRGQVGAYHRTLETYLNAFNRGSLAIDTIREPQPDENDPVAMRVPGYSEVPVVLAIRCRIRLEPD